MLEKKQKIMWNAMQLFISEASRDTICGVYSNKTPSLPLVHALKRLKACIKSKRAVPCDVLRPRIIRINPHSHSYERIYTKCNIVLTIAFIWLFSVSMNLPTILGVWAVSMVQLRKLDGISRGKPAGDLRFLVFHASEEKLGGSLRFDVHSSSDNPKIMRIIDLELDNLIKRASQEALLVCRSTTGKMSDGSSEKYSVDALPKLPIRASSLFFTPKIKFVADFNTTTTSEATVAIMATSN
ncbi:unnamed protein product [Notodromas monacha]|uniref:Uncharacterized protein n=1 Tax=Notodromas monacha TaxID=399045 RepID=A0A7R9BJM2_9CRUS|nr:unnamed protein product [Notodromas monacha]CAG0915873.1 unnamed protein product [Notodromas monacha]